MHPAIEWLESQYEIARFDLFARPQGGGSDLYSIKDDTCDYCNEDEEFAHCVGILRNMYYRHVSIPDSELIQDMDKYPCP